MKCISVSWWRMLIAAGVLAGMTLTPGRVIAAGATGNTLSTDDVAAWLESRVNGPDGLIPQRMCLAIEWGAVTSTWMTRGEIEDGFGRIRSRPAHPEYRRWSQLESLAKQPQHVRHRDLWQSRGYFVRTSTTRVGSSSSHPVATSLHSRLGRYEDTIFMVTELGFEDDQGRQWDLSSHQPWTAPASFVAIRRDTPFLAGSDLSGFIDSTRSDLGLWLCGGLLDPLLRFTRVNVTQEGANRWLATFRNDVDAVIATLLLRSVKLEAQTVFAPLVLTRGTAENPLGYTLEFSDHRAIEGLEGVVPFSAVKRLNDGLTVSSGIAWATVIPDHEIEAFSEPALGPAPEGALDLRDFRDGVGDAGASGTAATAPKAATMVWTGDAPIARVALRPQGDQNSSGELTLVADPLSEHTGPPTAVLDESAARPGSVSQMVFLVGLIVAAAAVLAGGIIVYRHAKG